MIFDVQCKSRSLRLHGAVGTPGASGSLKPWLVIGYDYGVPGCDRDHDHFRHVVEPQVTHWDLARVSPEILVGTPIATISTK